VPLDEPVVSVFSLVSIGEVQDRVLLTQIRHRIQCGLHVIGMDKFQKLPLLKLFSGITEYVFPGGVDLDEIPRSICNAEKIEGNTKEVLQLFGTFLKCLVAAGQFCSTLLNDLLKVLIQIDQLLLGFFAVADILLDREEVDQFSMLVQRLSFY
jgi:hypothetical protein